MSNVKKYYRKRNSVRKQKRLCSPSLAIIESSDVHRVVLRLLVKSMPTNDTH